MVLAAARATLFVILWLFVDVVIVELVYLPQAKAFLSSASMCNSNSYPAMRPLSSTESSFSYSCRTHRRKRAAASAERRWTRMDDEVARDGIKTELTTRDDYLETRFTKLSASGHDLTPLTPQEIQEAASSLPAGASVVLFGDDSEQQMTAASTPRRFRDHREKGLYACAVGGLPLFTSGWKLEPRAEDTCPSFAEPCDEEHLLERQDGEGGITNVFCSRSGLRVGAVVSDDTSPSGRRYLIIDEALEFHPLGKPLPVRCQPENYWGSEGQYRAWQFSE